MTDHPEYRRLLAEMRRLAEAEPDRASADGARLDELAEIAAGYEADGTTVGQDDAEDR
jgi:hypothetical protein